MPRIKRWFPVSHDFNRDPDIRVMIRQCGERSLRVWLEILSIADRNDGLVPGESEGLLTALGGASEASPRTVRATLDYAQSHAWLASDPTLRVVNYGKYHRIEERKPIPSGSANRSPPNLTKPDLTRPKKIKIPKIPYPSDFSVSQELRSWCQTQYAKPEDHLEAFKDYHISHGSKFIDWDAAFRTWVRNAQRFANKNQTRPAMEPSRPTGVVKQLKREEKTRQEGQVNAKAFLSDLAKKMS